MKTTDSPTRSVWFDLPVVDLVDAMSFYEGLLGWKYRQMDQSTESDYVMIEAEGALIGGLRKVASLAPSSKDQPTAPLPYFSVENLARGVSRARELGAALVGPTVQLGRERGCYQWIRDREGNVIGLWAPQ